MIFMSKYYDFAPVANQHTLHVHLAVENTLA